MAMEVTMAAKEAVRHALELAKEFFASDKITNLGLEEVGYDSDRKAWLITVGFSRPWDYVKKTSLPLAWISPLSESTGYEPQPAREYKVVELSDETLELLAIKDREHREAAVPA
jgi:hypothetical protein